MEEKKSSQVTVKAPENLVTYDPDKLPYEKQHLCIYMRELLDEAEAEKASQDSAPEHKARQCQEFMKDGNR
jgi:hypothetical protein